ncbi:3-oxoacid CoA-transferase subunit B [Nonomuraea terrae]|uniref:3-oxoacid CoA-transferase subunit B n=1 Tax=Nonomuraea terrae TaxID=2530383 RepID=UPI00378D9E52
MSRAGWSREDMARRVAADIPDGSYVNIGVGLPVLVPGFVPSDREIVYHSENGILGMGPPPAPGAEDPELINANKQMVTLVAGGAYFHHTDAFVMMRGGHIDIAVLGAFQVSERGDLANWTTGDSSMPPAVGGAMDLAAGARRILVMMTHTTKDGSPKLLPRCTYPLTAAGVVDRVYTDLAVLDVGAAEGALVVREIAPGVTRSDLVAATAAKLVFP